MRPESFYLKRVTTKVISLLSFLGLREERTQRANVKRWRQNCFKMMYQVLCFFNIRVYNFLFFSHYKGNMSIQWIMQMMNKSESENKKANNLSRQRQPLWKFWCISLKCIFHFNIFLNINMPGIAYHMLSYNDIHLASIE